MMSRLSDVVLKVFDQSMTVATSAYFFKIWREKIKDGEPERRPLEDMTSDARCIIAVKVSGMRSAAARMFSYLK